MRLVRPILRLATVISALFSGALFTSCPMYGTVGPATPQPELPAHDPTVQITDFSYAPASPVQAGVEITFTATLNKPTDAGTVWVYLGPPPGARFADLNDRGYQADTVAGDGIYTGSGIWETWLKGVVDTPVMAHLWWYDGYPEQLMGAAPLTIISPEGQI